MARDKLKTIHGWSPVLLCRIRGACQKNSLVLFGFDAHVMINLLENVAPANNKTEILRLAGS